MGTPPSNELSVKAEGCRKLSDLFMEINHLFMSSFNGEIFIPRVEHGDSRWASWCVREILCLPGISSNASFYGEDVSGVADSGVKCYLTNNLLINVKSNRILTNLLFMLIQNNILILFVCFTF